MSWRGETGDRGVAPPRSRRKGPPVGGIKRNVREPGERLTPPCRSCRLPLLKGENACPRCGAEVARV